MSFEELRPVEGQETYTKLVAELADPDSLFDTIHERISCMPVFATHLLRLANGPLNSGDMPIQRIDRAITLLGRDTVYDLAKEAKAARGFPDQVAGFDTARLVRHHVVVSRAAQLVAHAARLPLGDAARAAGLIHDIGIFRQLEVNPTEFAEACHEAAQARTRITDHEGLHCHTDHCERAENLLTRWGLAPGLVAAVGYHHDPLAAPAEFRFLTVLLYASECLAMRAGFRFLYGNRTLALEESVLASLRISDPQLRAYVPVLRNLVEQADRRFLNPQPKVSS